MVHIYRNSNGDNMLNKGGITMTFESTKRLLKELKSIRRLTRVLQAEIKELESDYAQLTLHSALTSTEPISHSGCNSPVERALEKLELQRTKYTNALERLYTLENQISDAMEFLTETEKEIIIKYYLQDKNHYKIAYECCYSEQHIRRLKNRAVYILSKNINERK